MSIKNRSDFVYFFDVKDGNPNGDPDAGNHPRIDPETGHGLVTDVALKRKVRNYVTITRGAVPPHDIYIKEKSVLEDTHEKAYLALKLKIDEGEKRSGGENVDKVRAWMCQNFYDVRTFGAMMATKKNAGVVRGPVQFTFARSLDPVVSLEHSITRMAVTTQKEADEQKGDNRTMGRKHTISYGLYRAHGFVSPFFAEQSGFSEEDLALLCEAMVGMWDHDRSAARGEMSCRGLYLFRHVSENANEARLGTAPAHKLFDLVTASKTSEIPRTFSDYRVQVDRAALKNQFPGINLQQLA